MVSAAVAGSLVWMWPESSNPPVPESAGGDGEATATAPPVATPPSGGGAGARPGRPYGAPEGNPWGPPQGQGGTPAPELLVRRWLEEFDGRDSPPDGRVSREEAPRPFWDAHGGADRDGDGVLNSDELRTAAENPPRGRRPGGPGEPPPFEGGPWRPDGPRGGPRRD